MTLNRRIEEILGGFGIKNHGEAHRFFYDRSLEEVYKYLENPQDYNIFRDPLTYQFFTDVVNSKRGKDLYKKYHLSKNRLIDKIKRIVGKYDVKNYTALKNYLKEHGVDESLRYFAKKEDK